MRPLFPQKHHQKQQLNPLFKTKQHCVVIFTFNDWAFPLLYLTGIMLQNKSVDIPKITIAKGLCKYRGHKPVLCWINP